MKTLVGLVLCLQLAKLSDAKGVVRFPTSWMNRVHKGEGFIRLTGGSTHSEGNVEILHNGVWGNLCDDEWDSREAKVVCYQLGYFHSAAIPTHGSHFGQSKNFFWMDDMHCTGEEKRLYQCRFNGWGRHDCAKTEAAGVICFNNYTRPNLKDVFIEENILQPDIESKIFISEITKGQMTFSLNRQMTKDKSGQGGLIKVSSNPTFTGYICGEDWSLKEANVLCKQLGLGYAQEATQMQIIPGTGIEKVIMSGVECEGNEISLQQCRANDKVLCQGLTSQFSPPSSALGNKKTLTTTGTVAGVICTSDLPDLVLDFKEIEKSAFIEHRPLYYLQCAMEENCLSKSAYESKARHPQSWHLESRRLLRFTAKTTNVGTVPFRPFIPKHLWQFHLCHMHYHSMEVFATFDIYSGTRKVAEGHKASFCLEDNMCSPHTTPKFSCANFGDQGISPNCSDVYRYDIDCQWVDVTDLNPGHYTFKVAVNPEFKVPEMCFDNNAARCELQLEETYARIFNCVHEKP